MVMVFVSLGLRFRVEVEALNMTESLGAYTRHRTVSLLKKFKKQSGEIGYKIVTVPAISGQSISHGYHRALVEVAKKMGLEVCEECRKYEIIGGFIKHGTAGKNISDIEVVKNCVVEDITGFMVPDANIRRTSAIMFSYMIPDIEYAETAIEPQFHVRYDFRTQKHNPFQIESGTAIYMLGVAIDVDKIGKIATQKGEIIVDNRIERIKAAFLALSTLIEGLVFGAKKARYLPILEVAGGISAISHPIPFMVTPPRGYNYIKNTIERALTYRDVLRDLGEVIKIIYLDKEGFEKPEIEYKDMILQVDSFSEMISKTLDNVLEIIKKQ